MGRGGVETHAGEKDGATAEGSLEEFASLDGLGDGGSNYEGRVSPELDRRSSSARVAPEDQEEGLIERDSNGLETAEQNEISPVEALDDPNNMAGRGVASPVKRPPTLNVAPDVGMTQQGNWQPLSPRSADRLLGNKSGAAGGEAGGGGLMSPGGSPLYPSPDKKDSRRTILLNLTYLNLFLALVLLILGAAGPAYPGHSGTTDNSYNDGNNRRLTTQDSPLYQTNCPTGEVDSANASILHSALIIGLVIWFTQPFFARRIYKHVDRRGAAETLLTSVVGAFTCLGAFAVVMVDINYIAGCCSLLEDNCEVSNLCTQFVDDCCISDDVEEYCDNPSYHVAAVSMIFLVFVSNSAMMIMACTMTCRCWLDSDPEKKAMMMIITGSPRGQTPSPASPMFSPRANVLAGEGGATSPARRTVTSRQSSAKARGHSGAAGAGTGGGGGGGGGREKCPHCGAMFGNAVTLVNHVERFHSKVGSRKGGMRRGLVVIVGEVTRELEGRWTGSGGEGGKKYPQSGAMFGSAVTLEACSMLRDGGSGNGNSDENDKHTGAFNRGDGVCSDGDTVADNIIRRNIGVGVGIVVDIDIGIAIDNDDFIGIFNSSGSCRGDGSGISSGQARTPVGAGGGGIELPAGVAKRALARKGSNYMPDEMPNIISYSQVQGLK
eukprot:jgi/Undpi1/348/HiC_scaffold_1.g00344.m1